MKWLIDTRTNGNRPGHSPLSHDASARQPLTQLGQRVLHLEVILVEAQHPPRDIQGVVPCTAGNGVRPGVQADLGKGQRLEVTGQRNGQTQ